MLNYLTPIHKPVLSTFSLVMINVIAIDSLRNIPVAAEYGFSLLFYYLLAATIFFIPSALISAELATGWPKNGGVYIWVKEAFGENYGFLAIWLQWIQNVIWYPTMLTFITSTLLTSINPILAENKLLMLSIVISIFWLGTWLNIRGLKFSSVISVITAIAGTIMPMLMIIGLGAYWIFSGKIIQIDISLHSFFPNSTSFDNISFLTGIFLSLVGMELSATHIQDVHNPQYNYPKSIFISIAIILLTLSFSSLAIAIVIPQHQIHILVGLLQAFNYFFTAYHLSWLSSLIVAMIILGGFGSIVTWIIGPSKGLLAAAKDSDMLTIFCKVNRYGAPSNLLIFQAVIMTLLCSIFLLMPSVSSSYWLLSVLSTQLYMLMYLLLFSSGIKLRYKQPLIPRGYQIPVGNLGMCILGSLGIISCTITILIGFIPPATLNIHNPLKYILILLIGILILNIPPLIKKVYSSKKSNAQILTD